MNIKKILFFIIIYTGLTSFSQKIFVEYGVAINQEENLFDKNQSLKTYFNKAVKNAPNLKFGLICKNKESKFYNISTLNNDSSISKTDLVFAGYRGLIYDLGDSLLSESNILGNNIFVLKKKENEWVLHNEEKLINGYKCFKATSFYIVQGIDKIFKHPVIAWYCPSISYSFGPNGYGNLPGLILELQVRNVVYGVKKIQLDTENDFSINKNKLKIISEIEYNNRLYKFNDF